MSKTEAAVADFKSGYSCAQSVLVAFASECGLDRATALKVAAGFGGGMGRMALTCGAVTGAFMVIGLKHGATAASDAERKQKTYALVREFDKRFKARRGSTTCRDLLGCDISAPGGFEEASRRGLIQTVCPPLVADAVEILDEIL